MIDAIRRLFGLSATSQKEKKKEERFKLMEKLDREEEKKEGKRNRKIEESGPKTSSSGKKRGRPRREDTEEVLLYPLNCLPKRRRVLDSNGLEIASSTSYFTTRPQESYPPDEDESVPSTSYNATAAICPLTGLSRQLKSAIKNYAQKSSIQIEESWIEGKEKAKFISHIYEIVRLNNGGFIAMASIKKKEERVHRRVLFRVNSLPESNIREWIDREEGLEAIKKELKRTAPVLYKKNFDEIFRRPVVPIHHSISKKRPARTDEKIWDAKSIEMAWNDELQLKFPNHPHLSLLVWTTGAINNLPNFEFKCEILWTSRALKQKALLEKKKCKCQGLCRDCTINCLIFDYRDGRLVVENEEKVKQSSVMAKFALVKICQGDNTGSCSCKGCPRKQVKEGCQYPLAVCSEEKYQHFGLRTLKKIPAGSYLGIYYGQVIPSKEDTYTFSLTEGLAVDAKLVGNYTRFFGHSCRPNLMPVWLCPPGQAKTANVLMAFFAIRDIEAGEDLVFNYGFGESKKGKLVRCSCISRNLDLCENRYPF